MSLRRVIIESPYAAKTIEELEANITYARAAVRDCLLRYHEAPLASHLLYTQPRILHDDVPDERALGMKAGFAWTPHADAVVVYTDRGISPGMKAGITRAEAAGIPIEYRTLHAPQDDSVSPAVLSRLLLTVGLTATPDELTEAVRTPLDMREILAWIDHGADLAAAPDCISKLLFSSKKETP